MGKKAFIIEYEKDSSLVYTILEETVKMVARDLVKEYKEDPHGYAVEDLDSHELSIQAYNDAIDILRDNLKMHEVFVWDPPLEL